MVRFVSQSLPIQVINSDLELEGKGEEMKEMSQSLPIQVINSDLMFFTKFGGER